VSDAQALAERHALVERIFLDVLDLPPDERRRVLDERCAGDAALLREVESLLGFSSRANRFLDHHELLALTPELVRPPDESLAPGTRVGEYTIERLIGTGGMGTVYLAKQERPRRTVALKLVSASIASPSIRRRFELEAEVLGRLQHPGIAQIFEAGAAFIGGAEVRRPFIAMEFIDGEPITDFCTSRSLGSRERIALFVKVCDAVQHAHQRGVIHRDLKPANILVDASGQPKVLDFGVARATNADHISTTMSTGVGQLVGTLPYMSPEQVLGDPREVDIRSDVYALGVMLFELLTGALPLDVTGRSLPEAVRIIRQDDPARLSAVSKVFRGDLDTIAGKSLEKDRQRRYQTAADLADDLRRYLDGQPIAAKDDSAFYVLRKQLRRYRGAVAVAVAGVVTLAGFAVQGRRQAVMQAQLASSERAARLEADAARDAARATADQLRRNLYVSNIGFAQAALSAHDTPRMRRALDQCPSDLRGWEWKYLSSVVDASTTRFRMPPPTAGLLSDDPDVFYTWSNSSVVALNDAVTGARLASADVGDAAVLAVIGARGSDVFFAGDILGRIHRIDARTCEVRSVFVDTPASIWPVAVFPDHRRVLAYGPESSGTRYARVIDSLTGESLRVLPMPTPSAFAVSPDGRTIALGNDEGDVEIFREDGARTLVLKHSLAVRDLQFSPSGTKLASAGADGVVRTYDLASGLSTQFRAFENKAVSVAWSPDETYIAAGGTEAVIGVFDAASGANVTWLHGHDATVAHLVWSPSGDQLTSLGFDASVRTWNAPATPRQPRVKFDSPIITAAWSPDGAWVYVGCSDGRLVRLRGADLQEIAQLARFDSGVNEIQVAPGGARIAVALQGGDGLVIDASSGRTISRWKSDLGRAIDVAFTSDGKRVAFGSDSPRLTVWDAETGAEVASMPRQGSAPIRIAWSPDDSILAGAYYDHVVRLHDPRTGRVVREFYGPTSWVSQLRFTNDGARLVASSDDGVIHVWTLDDSAPPRAIRGHALGVYSVSFTPDFSRIATGGWDNTLRIFDLDTGQEMLMFRPHIGAVWVAEYDAQGNRLVSGSGDGTLILW
jgi:eukaryotic-like serine/threonine-protein kinase